MLLQHPLLVLVVLLHQHVVVAYQDLLLLLQLRVVLVAELVWADAWDRLRDANLVFLVGAVSVPVAFEDALLTLGILGLALLLQVCISVVLVSLILLVVLEAHDVELVQLDVDDV